MARDRSFSQALATRSGQIELARWGGGALDALSESLDEFLEIRESAVLVHDLISPSKFLENEYSDYFCLL